MPDVEPAIPEAVGPPVLPGPVEPAAPVQAESPAAGVARPGEEPAGAFEGDEELVAAAPARPARAKPSGNRVAAFVRASWAELQRVQWPDRRQVGQATAVVLGFVVIAGSFLGIADLLASKLVDAIL